MIFEKVVDSGLTALVVDAELSITTGGVVDFSVVLKKAIVPCWRVEIIFERVVDSTAELLVVLEGSFTCVVFNGLFELDD